MRHLPAGTLKSPAPTSQSDQTRRAARWRTTGYVLSIGLLLLVALASLRPDLDRIELPDWKPVVALADAAWEQGDLSAARRLYLQVEQIASSQQDWEGLVAAACGVKKLDGWKGSIPRLLRS
jgi:hypothetical protein